MQQNTSRFDYHCQPTSQIRNILCDEGLPAYVDSSQKTPVYLLHSGTEPARPPTERSQVRCSACSRAWQQAVFVDGEQALHFTGQFWCLGFLSFYVPWTHCTCPSSPSDIYPKLYVKHKHVKRFPSGRMWFLFSLFTNPQDWFFRYWVWKDEFNIEGAALFGLIVTKLDSLQMTQSLWAAQPRPTVTVRSPIRVN